jgi:DNA-binding protein YbaB
MSFRFAFAFALAASGTALAADDGIYKWTDQAGEVHYTNDLTSPPGDTVLTPVTGDELSVISVTPPAPPKREERREAAAQATRAQADAAQGLPESYWRGAFQDARQKIQRLQDELEQTQALFESNGLPVNFRVYGLGGGCLLPFGCLGSAQGFEQTKVRMRQLEREVKQAQDELADLDRRASYAGVPREWRR